MAFGGPAAPREAPLARSGRVLRGVPVVEQHLFFLSERHSNDPLAERVEDAPRRETLPGDGLAQERQADRRRVTREERLADPVHPRCDRGGPPRVRRPPARAPPRVRQYRWSHKAGPSPPRARQPGGAPLPRTAPPGLPAARCPADRRPGRARRAPRTPPSA